MSSLARGHAAVAAPLLPCFSLFMTLLLSGCETFDYLDNRIKCIESLTGEVSMDGRGWSMCLSW